MSPKVKGIVRAVLAVVVLLAIVAIALMFWVRSSPLSIYEKASRKRLVEVGLERAEIEAAWGPLVYWAGGEGPPLVLIHGSGHQAGVWADTAAALTDAYRVIVPDLPGHYQSEPLYGPLGMDVLYGAVETLVSEAAEGEPAILVGNSLGAWLALIQAHRHPETVARVVALNGGALANDYGDLNLAPPDRAAARKLVEALRDPASEEIPDFVLDDLVQRSADGPAARMMLDWEGLTAHLLDGRLGEIAVPVDLVWGESDQLMKLDYARRHTDELPRGRLTTIPACGHMPHSECPERYLETLLSVLDQEPPEAREPTPADEAGADAPPGDEAEASATEEAA